MGRYSPYKSVAGLTVRAVSIKGRVPQGYIDRDEAETACENAGKRLCTDDEWIEACKGKNPTQYPYGDDHKDGYCNDAVRELVFLEVAQRRVVRGWYRISRRDGWVLADEVLVCAGDDLESRLADIREAALGGLEVAFRREARALTDEVMCAMGAGA